MVVLKFLSEQVVLFVITILLVVVNFANPGLASGYNVLPYIIQLPENENAILVEKKTQTLFLITNADNNWAEVFQVPCSTGEIGGVKLRSGDKKTPEGIYFVKDEYEDKYLTPVYGKKAFPIDYPNFLDKRDGKNGSAIWIHGTNKTLKPMDSNGCIALENKNVVKLSDYVTLDSTPVILVEEINDHDNRDMVEKQKTQIHEFLNQWTMALETGTYQAYLSFYSSSYLPQIDFWRHWLKARQRFATRDERVSITHENIGIYFYNDTFVVLFDQLATLEEQKVLTGKRKLFLAIEDGIYKIVGDVYQRIPVALDKNGSPLIGSLEIAFDPQLKEKRITQTVRSWLAAWSTKDMKKYASFYADRFYSDGMNKRQWVDRKKRISQQYSYINVTGSHFKVRQKKETCVVEFLQTYESSGFVAKGKKQLKLIKIGGSWKIFQESWKKK